MTDEPHRPITITVEQGSKRLRFTTTPTPDGRVSIEEVGFTDDGEITTNLSGVLPAETMTTLGWLILQSSTTGQDPVGFAQGTPLAALAQELGRNTGAIRSRLTRPGIDEPEPG